MLMKYFILIAINCNYLIATIDLNLAEFQHVADHLQPEECRKLIAALHFNTYDLPNGIDQAELRVSKDIPCIRLLLHWNSLKGEGKGETHEILEHRLRQLGKIELADWIGKTVFRELGNDLDRNLNDLILNNDKKLRTHRFSTILPNFDLRDKREWTAFDSICWVLIIGLSVATILILIKATCVLYVKKQPNRRLFKRKMQYSKLLALDTSDSESERFDIRAVLKKNSGFTDNA